MTKSIIFLTIISGIFIIFVFIGQPQLKAYIGNGFEIYLAILLPASIFAFLTRSILQGEKKNTRAIALSTFRKIATYAIGSSAIIYGFDPSLALVSGLICGRMLELFGGIILIDTHPAGTPQLEELVELTRRVVHLTAAGLGNLGQQWIDTLLIGAILTSDMVAIYEVAWRLSAVGLVVTNAVSSVLYPRFAQAVTSGDHHEVRRYANKAFFYVSMPMIALFAGALALGTDLVTIIYGFEYAGAYLPLLVLLIGRFPYSLSRILFQLGYSYNIDRAVTIASVTAAVLNGIANILLIAWVGIVGAAIASLLSYAVLALLMFNQLSDRIGHPKIRQFAPGIAAAGIMAASVKILSVMASLSLKSLVLLVLIGAILFGGSLILLSPIVKADIRRVINSDMISELR